MEQFWENGPNGGDVTLLRANSVGHVFAVTNDGFYSRLYRRSYDRDVWVDMGVSNMEIKGLVIDSSDRMFWRRIPDQRISFCVSGHETVRNSDCGMKRICISRNSRGRQKRMKTSSAFNIRHSELEMSLLAHECRPPYLDPYFNRISFREGCIHDQTRNND